MGGKVIIAVVLIFLSSFGKLKELLITLFG